jgi:hypothetical protein
MTQDQSNSVHGTDYVVRGEVVPDDETEEFSSDESGPMTRLRKVASAMRGDKPDQTIPDQMTTTDETDAGEYADAARADDVGAVRSPETEDGDYWDDERASHETAPGGGLTATNPDPDLDPMETDPAGPGDTGPSVAYPTPADTMAEYHRETGTAADPQRPADSVPADSVAADSVAADRDAADTVPVGAVPADTDLADTDLADTDPAYTDRADAVPAGTLPAGTVPAGSGMAETGPVGKHAAAAADDAGLRPGEATDRLGDFGDIAFGNLLPDAAQYSAQWQQIQFRFVDDPQASVTEAADVLSQVTAKLEAAIQERQRAIEERKQAIQERASALRGRWGEGSNADTETLRETLRMYRAFMDQLIGTTP